MKNWAISENSRKYSKNPERRDFPENLEKPGSFIQTGKFIKKIENSRKHGKSLFHGKFHFSGFDFFFSKNLTLKGNINIFYGMPYLPLNSLKALEPYTIIAVDPTTNSIRHIPVARLGRPAIVQAALQDIY